MKIRRLHVESSSIRQERVEFTAKQAHYLLDVLRLRTGDEILVLDGASEHKVILNTIESNGLSGIILESRKPSFIAHDFHLAFGCVRPSAMEQIFRHGTELGVRRFHPIICRRSSRKPPEARARWQSIVKSAAEQCGRTELPKISDPCDLNNFIENDSSRIRFVADYKGTPISEAAAKQRSRSIAVIVGPEGGLTEEEFSLACNHDYIPVRLGRFTLRTETAALAFVAIFSAILDAQGE